MIVLAFILGVVVGVALASRAARMYRARWREAFALLERGPVVPGRWERSDRRRLTDRDREIVRALAAHRGRS